MKKILFKIIIFIIFNLSTLANAINNIAPNSALINADIFYRKNNSKELLKLANSYPQDISIKYLLAKLLLDKGDISYTEKFIKNSDNSYLKNDLLHQLLAYYYQHQNYTAYANTYPKLFNTQISTSETCAYYTSLIKNNTTDLINKHTNLNDNFDIDSVIQSGDISSQCSNYALLAYKNNTLTVRSFSLLLSNLLLNNRLSEFNSLARLATINTKDLPISSIYAIIQTAKRHPDLALVQFDNFFKNFNNKANSNNQVDIVFYKNLKYIIINNIAMQFALQQDFTKSMELFEYNQNDLLTNAEYEWRSRAYLAKLNWQGLIWSISTMPNDLQQKNSWKYWLAKAYQNTNNEDEANKLFGSISNDSSYYSILANNEIDDTGFKLNYYYNPNNNNNVKLSNNLTKEIDYIIGLYNLGRYNKAKSLEVIAIYQWYYINRIIDEKSKLNLSLIANKYGFYNLSIHSATQLNNRYVDLSFPKPFLEEYMAESKNLNIEFSYPLAISRQESRFNYSVIAFDGGIGLMQLMPNTVKYILKKSHYSSCKPINHQCNIKLGSWYLANLYKKFGNIIYSTAAYNAGPNRPRRWYNSIIHLDSAIQIELIPIAITRDYVQKVLTNKLMYDAVINHQSSINLLNYLNTLNNNDVIHDLNLLNDDNTDASKL